MTPMTTSSGDPVRAQYESFPYPPRDPARELELLRSTIASQLALANHALWGGARRMGPGFRVLDAGCGTGDNTVFAIFDQLIQSAGKNSVRKCTLSLNSKVGDKDVTKVFVLPGAASAPTPEMPAAARPAKVARAR